MNKIKTKKEKSHGSFLYAKFQKSSEVPFIISFLIRNRVVKSERTAIILVLFVACLFFLISITLFFNCFTYPVFINKIY